MSVCEEHTGFLLAPAFLGTGRYIIAIGAFLDFLQLQVSRAPYSEGFKLAEHVLDLAYVNFAGLLLVKDFEHLITLLSVQMQLMLPRPVVVLSDNGTVVDRHSEPLADGRIPVAAAGMGF